MNRFSFVKEMDLPLSLSFESSSDRLNCCVVYVIWDSTPHILASHLSLCSQFLNSDINRCDIKFFVSRHLMDIASRYTEKFPNVEIRKLPYGSFKYSLFADESLANYDKIVTMDADAYFWGQRKPLYADLVSCSDLYIGNYNRTEKKPLRTICKRKRFSHFREKGQDEFLDAVSKVAGDDIHQLCSGKKWIFGMVHCIDRKLITDDFRNHMDRCREDLAVQSDELVLLSYFWKNGINITEMPTLGPYKIAVFDALSVMKKNNDDLIVAHPLFAEDKNKYRVAMDIICQSLKA